MSMIANDPHLGNSIPSFWQLQELIWGDNYLSGASVPGNPMIYVGKNKRITWTVTAALADISDLWQEELNEDETKYKVDGEWRDMVD